MIMFWNFGMYVGNHQSVLRSRKRSASLFRQSRSSRKLFRDPLLIEVPSSSLIPFRVAKKTWFSPQNGALKCCMLILRLTPGLRYSLCQGLLRQQDLAQQRESALTYWGLRKKMLHDGSTWCYRLHPIIFNNHHGYLKRSCKGRGGPGMLRGFA